jgi:hypothetical protein
MSDDNDGEVVDLAAVHAAPVPGVVGLIEVYLERARAGELRSVAIAGAMTGKTTSSGYELGDEVAADLCLALDRLKLRLVAPGLVEAVIWEDDDDD